MKLQAVVRGQGGNQKYVSTGLERLVVHVEKGEDTSTPNPNSFRFPIELVVDGVKYHGGLIIRSKPDPLISISPDLEDEAGRSTNLSSVFSGLGVEKNDKLELELKPLSITLTKP